MEETPKVADTQTSDTSTQPSTENKIDTECSGTCCAKSRRWCSLKRDHKIALIVLVILLVVAGANRYKGTFIAATVNGEAITRWEVIRELEKQSGRDALDALVTNKVIHDAATAQGIKITGEDLDQEITTIRERVEKQGKTTLEEVMQEQGVTMQSLQDQITSQKELEALLGEKIAVSDEEVTKYISDNKIPTAESMTEEDFRKAIQDQLKSQKLGQEASLWIETAKAKATITYLAPYSLSLNTPAGTDTEK